MSRRKLILAGSVIGAVALVAGGVWGGVSAAVASSERDLAIANSSIVKVTAGDAAVAKKLTSDQQAAKSLSGSARPLVSSLAGFAAADSLTSLNAQLDALDTISAGARAEHLMTSPVKSRDDSIAALQAAARQARAESAADKKLAAEDVAAEARIEKQLSSVTVSLARVAKTVPVVSAAVLSANPKADATVRATFQSQAGTAGTATSQAMIAALSAYAAKGKAVLDSQAAAVTLEQQIAAAKAQQAAASASGNASGSGSSRDSGSTTSTASGSGPTSTGGTPSRSNPVPTIPQRGNIVLSNSACVPGSSTANWTSSLVVPSTAINVRVTFEHPGTDWGVSWQCDTGW